MLFNNFGDWYGGWEKFYFVLKYCTINKIQSNTSSKIQYKIENLQHSHLVFGRLQVIFSFAKVKFSYAIDDVDLKLLHFHQPNRAGEEKVIVQRHQVVELSHIRIFKFERPIEAGSDLKEVDDISCHPKQRRPS